MPSNRTRQTLPITPGPHLSSTPSHPFGLTLALDPDPSPPNPVSMPPTALPFSTNTHTPCIAPTPCHQLQHKHHLHPINVNTHTHSCQAPRALPSTSPVSSLTPPSSHPLHHPVLILPPSCSLGGAHPPRWPCGAALARTRERAARERRSLFLSG